MKLLTAATCAALISASAASATTYNIDGFINSWDEGFGSTMFHATTGCDAMCGSLYDRATGTGSGTWDDVTGSIDFVMDLVGGGMATVTGFLNFGVTSGPVGVFDTTISGSQYGLDGDYSFQFLDHDYGMGGANSFDEGVIALWGASGGTALENGGFAHADLGVDFRIAVSPIPLPASAVLMMTAIAGLGGFGFVGRRRKPAEA